MVSRSSSLTKSKLRPLTIELKSGWDDFLDEKKSRRTLSPMLSKRFTASVCSSPTPSHKSITEEDQEFMESTISYLGSPTAKVLGIAAPLVAPPAAVSPPSRNAFEIPPKPSSPPPLAPGSKPKSILKAPPKSVPVDVIEPAISSVLDANWPIPPVSPSPTPSGSHSSHGSWRSPSHSPAASSEEAIGYPLRPTVTPPHLRTRPFEGSNVSPPTNATVSPRKSALRRTSIRTLHKSWSRERIGMGNPGNDVIYMTVVKETA